MPILFAIALLVIAASRIVAAQDGPNQSSGLRHPEQARRGYGKVPLNFEINAGQADSRVKFLSRGSGYTLFLTSDEAVLALQKAGGQRQHANRSIVRMRFAGGSRQVRVEQSGARAGSVNYFVGDKARWRRDVPAYSRVLYRAVYPGIDLVFYGNEGELEYDFVVAPRADVTAIRLAFEGTTLAIDAEGDLVGAVDGGSIRMRKPVLYQDVAGERVPIHGSWQLIRADQAGFRVADYDRSKPLVIDPVLSYSTYLGGSLDDTGAGIAVDTLGNSYVTGATTSLDFPTTGTALQAALAGSNDAFVTKLGPTGSTLVYSTYLGGSGSDAGADVAVDALGNVYLTGSTMSADFPTTPGAIQTFGGETDTFVSKLGPTGATLIYSTFLGGSDVDSSNGIALDAIGSAYVVGSSLSPDFPTTAGAYQPAPRSGLPAPPTFTPSRYDAFVTKLAPTGSLAYSTYLGGTDSEVGADIAVDLTGNAYVTGVTRSVDFPTTPGALQSIGGGSSEAAYVTKLDASGASLQYSTYLGGSHHDFGAGIAVDAAGHAYVTGGTMSSDFPTTPTAAQSVFGGDADAFVAKLQPTGAGLAYSTYLGSSSQEWADDIAVDPAGNAAVAGTTRSTDFPTTAATIQPTFGGGPYDAFVAKLDAAGSIAYVTYLGGSDAEFASAVAADSAGSVYVTGFVVSADFPTTAGSVQPTFGGDRDAFVVKIDDARPPSSVGKVTGGGSVALAGGLATFGFTVQRRAADAPVTGNLQYVNHATGVRVRAVTFTTLSVTERTAIVEGTCTVGKSPCTFTATITEGGALGADAFVIRISAAAAEGGVLRGGSVRIHP